MAKPETFPDYLRRWGEEELGHLGVSTRVGALAYLLGTSPKTVSAWLRGSGPRAPVAVLYRGGLERLRGLVGRVERELGRAR